MSWLSKLRPSRLWRETPREGLSHAEGHAPITRDTLAAIKELSRAVRNNPDAVEIYLALGNLFRSQGEMERAVRLREGLIARPTLHKRFKARAWFELGRDYKRAGFVERAVDAFSEARNIWGDTPELLLELARLHAEQGEFAAAAEHYRRLGHATAQAHYLVRQAELSRESSPSQARKALDKALAVFPGSVEAWSARLAGIMENPEKRGGDRLGPVMSQAYHAVDPKHRFALLELVLAEIETGEQARSLAGLLGTLCAEHPRDRFVVYYTGCALLMAGDLTLARERFEAALDMDSEFWPARLELVSLVLAEKQPKYGDSGYPELAEHLDFFLGQARRVKRFVCSQCGLKRERVFFVCPRCHGWHSIAFRERLQD
ncbi:MAG: hypothetical protein D6E12_13305 [Desulfovibrio sp.]|nr:MAG: hypothetical protein D6E12_13305 [Desulfovibrio sp.]